MDEGSGRLSAKGNAPPREASSTDPLGAVRRVEEEVKRVAAPVGESALTDDDRASLLAIVSEGDLPRAVHFLHALVSERGLKRESLLLLLIAPTARALGEQWKREERSFEEITRALEATQQLAAFLAGEITTTNEPTSSSDDAGAKPEGDKRP